MGKAFKKDTVYHEILRKHTEFYERLGMYPTIVFIGIRAANELHKEMAVSMATPTDISRATIAGMQLELSRDLDPDDVVLSF